MTTRVAIVSIYYPPATQSNAAIVATIATGLAARGFDVTVITATQRATAHDGVRIARVGSWPQGRPAFLARVSAYATFAWNAGRATRRLRPDVTIVVSPPPLLPLAMGRGRLIYAIQDLYPDVITAGTVPLAPVLRAIVGPLERLARRRARMCVVLGPRIGSLVARDVGAGRIAVVPNPLAFATAQAPAPFEWERLLPGDRSMPVLLYAGTLGRPQDFELLLDAALELNAAGVRVAIVGDGARRRWIDDRLTGGGFTLTRRLDPLPADRVEALFTSATIGAVPLRPGVAYASYPSKAATVMAAGRAVVVTAEQDSDIATAVRAANAGIVIAPRDTTAFVAAIRELVGDPERRERMGRAGRAYVSAELSGARASERYASVVGSVLAGAPARER